MASSLSLESVRLFILERGGRVSQVEITKHFKSFVNDPGNPDAKTKFKEIVNQLASVKKINNEKFLVLKKKYQEKSLKEADDESSQTASVRQAVQKKHSSLDTLDSVDVDEGGFGLERGNICKASSLHQLDLSPIPHSRSIPELPLYANPPEYSRSQSLSSSHMDSSETDAPSVPIAPPRKKSIKENRKGKAPDPPSQSSVGTMQTQEKEKDAPRISVKEQAQKLNKIVSESQLSLVTTPVKKSEKNKKHEDEDGSSVSNLDSRTREWMIKSAQNDYHSLVRLLKDEPRLANHRDPIFGYTALHWAAKHGNCEIVKLIAGTHGVDVNILSNGGYTPLHLSAIHNHQALYDLLLQTYGANAELRDFSGKRASQHFRSAESKPGSGKTNQYHTGKKTMEKDLSFLRIGSFNVKVRKTTEALERGSRESCPPHLKGWGSADNLNSTSDKHQMPPPKNEPPGRRSKARRAITRSSGSVESIHSDSDTEGGRAFKP